MALIAYSSSQIELLADQLCSILHEQIRQNPLRTFQIAAPNHRLIHWLNNRITDSLGVCLNVKFVYLENLLKESLETEETASRRDVRIQWTNAIFKEIAEVAESEVSELTRLKQSWELAGVFDQYAEHRPEWLIEKPYFQSESLDAEKQRILWSSIEQSASTLKHPLLHYIHQRKAVTSFPMGTLHLFGYWSLSPIQWDMLLQLTETTEAYLYLPLPSNTYLVDLSKANASSEPLFFPDDNNTQSRYQLLARLGRTAKAMQLQLLDSNIDEATLNPQYTGTSNTLKALQILISDPDSLNSDSPQSLRVDDSIQIHSCSGPRRELEIAKYCILNAIEEHPQIQLEQITVYAPNIDDYASLIPAVFNEFENDEQMAYHIHQSQAAEENPFFQAIFKMLSWADQVWNLPSLLEWMHLTPIKEHFNWEDDHIEIMAGWLRDSGAFLGRETTHDATYASQFTLDAGLRKLIQSYSQGDWSHTSNTWRSVVNQPEMFEAFITFIQAVDLAQQEFDSSAKTTQRWQQLIEYHAKSFISHESYFTEFRILQDSLTDLSNLFDAKTLFSLESFSQILKYHLPHLPLESAQSRRSGIHFSSIGNHNLIPSSIIILLGMNDGKFPRTDNQSSINLIQQNPQRFSDPSPRHDDRYWLLQSLLQCRDQWIVIYQGSNLQNTESISLSPDIESIQTTIHEEIPKYFKADQSIELTVQTHSRFAHEAAFNEEDNQITHYEAHHQAASNAMVSKSNSKAFIDKPINYTDTSQSASLNTVAKWLTRSAAYYCNNILGLRIPETSEEPREHEPFIWYSNSLEDYKIHSIIREGILDSLNPDAIKDKLDSQGLMPESNISEGWFSEYLNTHQQWHKAMPPDVEILNPIEDLDYSEIRIGDSPFEGCCLNREIEQLGLMRTSKYKMRNLLEIWLLSLCLNAASKHDKPTHLFYFAKDRWASINPVEDSLSQLRVIIELFRKYQSTPFPFYPETSQVAYKMSKPDISKIRTDTKWASREFWGESYDPYIRLTLQNKEPFEDEFWEVANTIYKPLFDHLNSPKKYDPV